MDADSAVAAAACILSEPRVNTRQALRKGGCRQERLCTRWARCGCTHALAQRQEEAGQPATHTPTSPSTTRTVFCSRTATPAGKAAISGRDSAAPQVISNRNDAFPYGLQRAPRASDTHAPQRRQEGQQPESAVPNHPRPFPPNPPLQLRRGTQVTAGARSAFYAAPSIHNSPHQRDLPKPDISDF